MAFASDPARAAFRYPNFCYFQGARFLIVLAAEMQSVAVGWQLFEITRRPLDLGLAGLAQFLPGLLLFLVAGQTADRNPRKRIIMACYAGFALCSALLYVFANAGKTQVSAIYVILVLIGIVRAFNAPTGQAFAPLLVPPEHFPNAVAWGSSLFEAATIIGPALGGVVYGLTKSAHAVYAGAVVAFALAFVLVSRIRLTQPQVPRGATNLDSVLAGFRYVWQNKVVLGAVSLDLFAVLLGGAVALLPVFAREILRVGPWGLGILRSAPGVGALLTAVAVAHWPLRRNAGKVMFACVAGFGLFTIIFGFSKNLWLSLAALFMVGATDMISVIIRSTMVQLATPDAMRGRVSAVNMLFIGASNEFGQFESGITAQWFGTVPAVVLGGLGTLLVVVTWSRLFPQLRNADQLAPKATEIAAETAVTATPTD